MTTDPTPIRPEATHEVPVSVSQYPPGSFHETPQAPQYVYVVPSKPQGLAVAALVLGIVGLLFSWFTFGIPSILAVIFGHIALSNAKAGKWGGKGMAVAGLVMGWVAVGLFVLLIALIAVA